MDGLELGRPMEGKPRDLSDKTQPFCFGYILLCTRKPQRLRCRIHKDLAKGKIFCHWYRKTKRFRPANGRKTQRFVWQDTTLLLWIYLIHRKTERLRCMIHKELAERKTFCFWYRKTKRFRPANGRKTQRFVWQDTTLLLWIYITMYKIT